MTEQAPSAALAPQDDPNANEPVPAGASPEAQAEQNATQRAQNEQVAVAEERGEPAAERPTDTEEEHSMWGMSLGRTREIAGGGNIEEHTLDEEQDQPRDPMVLQRRYMRSRLAQEAGHIIGRAPENIGLWGKGDTYRGNGGILVDVDTLQKHRFPDGYRFTGDEVYANSRDLPRVLVDGEPAKNLAG